MLLPVDGGAYKYSYTLNLHNVMRIKITVME